MLFFQMYPTFQRFDCKVFLTEALRYFGAVPTRVVIDNTHVVVLHGTGREMVPVPEMAAFAERFGFQFMAHEFVDAHLAARVERPFWFVERNFLAGRHFADWQDLNQQARQWCDRVNATYQKHIRAVPRELFAVERQHLQPLPVRITLAAHRPPRGASSPRPNPHPEEQLILQAAPEITDYVTALKQRSRKLVVLTLRQLLRLVREYPREPLLAAVRKAAHYGLYDLDRVERMILRRVAQDYFQLKEHGGGSDETE